MTISRQLLFMHWKREKTSVIAEIVDGLSESLVKVTRENTYLETYALKGFQKHSGSPCMTFPSGFGVCEGDLVEWAYSEGNVTPEIWRVNDTSRFRWGTLALVDKVATDSKGKVLNLSKDSRTKASQSLFNDGEIEPDPNDWVEIRGNWDVSEDVVVHKGETLEVPKGTLDDRLLIYPIDIGEGEISAEMRLMESVDNTSAWLVFGYQDANCFFSAGIGGYRHKFTLNVREGLGSRKLAEQGSEKELHMKEWYPLSVSFSSSKFEVIYKDIPVLHGNHPSYKPGKVGLKVFGPVHAQFKNFRIVRHQPVRLDTIQIDDLHPVIREAGGSLFRSGHYAQAIFDAVKALEQFIREKTGSDLDGRKLMQRVFKAKDPLIRLNKGKSKSHKDEREGFALLYDGVIPGVRNPKAHDLVIQPDRVKAFEYLAMLSLLVRRADEGSVASGQEEKK